MKKTKSFTRMSAVAAAAMLAGSMSTTINAYEGDHSVLFTYSGDSITAAVSDTAPEDISSSYSIDGSSLTISGSGTYVICGSSDSGDISVSADTEDVTLVLSELFLTSDDEDAVLTAGKNSDVTIIVDGENTLSETGSEGSVIKAKNGSRITFVGDDTDEGENTLNINASSDDTNGIKGAENADIIIGENADDDLTLNVSSTKNGIASDGTITVNGGDVNVTAGGGAAAASDDNSSKGIKADVAITINGGTITIDAADDGIHLGGTNGDEALAINGGTINISAGDDAIHSDYYLVIGTTDGTGKPTISISESCEGIEGAVIILNAGTGEVISSDDGINAANSDLENYSFSITVNGGTWYVNAGGDGLDSNGDITVNGGTTIVYGSEQGDNAALDYGDNNNSFTVNGGTIVGTGMSNMATVPTSGVYVQFGASGMMGGMGGFRENGMTPPEFDENFQGMTPPEMNGEQQGMTPPEMNGEQQGMTPPEMNGEMPGMAPFGMNMDNSGISITAGQLIEIKDSSGTTVYSFTAVKNANSIVISSDDLSEGSSYTLYADGEELITASAATGNNRVSGMFFGQGINPPANGQAVNGNTLPEQTAPVTKDNTVSESSTASSDTESSTSTDDTSTPAQGSYSYTAPLYSYTQSPDGASAGSGAVDNASSRSISRRKMKAIIRRYVIFNGSADYDEIHELMINSGFCAKGNFIVKVQGKKVASGWSEEAAKVIAELAKEGKIKVTSKGLFA
ncbi:MAG: carbohydrate-binding domain-containing protein [Oscillospiraceae bacterium]|nr:carbohydrate-binding domain-containing protein [Oscillospiraceae bacterium]